METISLAADGLSPDLVPLEELADCAQTALARDGRTILSYGAAGGYAPLRDLIGTWYGVHPSRVVLTNGRLHGLALLARRVLGRGGSVVAEYPIHDHAEAVFLAAGGSLISAPVDENGLVTQELQNTLGMYVRPSMVYVTPTFHNPTGWSTPETGRRRLIELVVTQNAVQTEQILLVEDDSYALTRFEGEPVPTVFDLSGRHTVYSSTFSTTIAPGLRVGFFILPDGLAEQLVEDATAATITPVLLAQATVHELIARGSFEPQVQRVRDGLRARRDAMLAALEKHFAGATWSRPEGGFFVWLQLPGSPDGREVLKRAEGVTAVAGTRFGTVSSALRLSYGFAAPDEIAAGVERLAAALP